MPYSSGIIHKEFMQEGSTINAHYLPRRYGAVSQTNSISTATNMGDARFFPLA